MRLIDADELKEPLVVLVKEGGFYRPMYQSFLKALENAPTIDAEPVVRCEDCKFSHFVKSCSKYECEKCSGFLRCPNDFCSYGEKKGEVSE